MDRSIGYGQKAMEFYCAAAGFPPLIGSDTSSQDSSRNSNNKHRQYARIMYASQSRGGMPDIFFFWQGLEVDHTTRSYTNSQLTGFILVKLRWRTRYGMHTHTDTRTHGQCVILSLAGSQNLCQTILSLAGSQNLCQTIKLKKITHGRGWRNSPNEAFSLNRDFSYRAFAGLKLAVFSENSDPF